MKTTIIATLFLIVGFLAGYILSPAQHVDTNLIHEKLSQISDSQLEELRMLENQDERFQKANQIYGQIFLMFLAQFGIRLDKEEWAPLLATSQILPTTEDDSPIQSKPTEDLGSIAESGSAPQVTVETVETKKAIPPTKWNPTQATRNYQQASNIKNVSPLMKKIQGTFTGIVYDIKDKEKDYTWDVFMDANYAHDGEKYQGEARIILTSPEDGEFSRNRSRGDNRVFQSNNSNPNTLYIEVSPSDYIELKVDGKGPTYHGMFYSMQNGSKMFQYKGKVQVTKN